MKDFNYIVLHGWAVNHLKLNSNEWIVYSYIYGYSQDGYNECKVNLDKLGETLNINGRTVLRILQTLVKKELIIKRDVKVSKNIKETYYRVNLEKIPVVLSNDSTDKMSPDSTDKMSPDSTDKMSPYNNNIIINKFNNARSAKKSKNKFNNFSQNNYDFKKIEDFLDEN